MMPQLVAVLRAAVAAQSIRRAVPSPQPAQRAGAADVDVRLLLEHHVDQEVVVDVRLVRRPELLEPAVALADLLHQPARSSATIFSALSSQTVTHSAHPLHLLGSMMMANRPPGLPCFSGPS